jgi:hypothetical protein
MALDQLLSRIADDKLSPEELHELMALLEHSAEHRETYIRYLQLHAHLRREGAGLSDMDEPVCSLVSSQLEIPEHEQVAESLIDAPITHIDRSLSKTARLAHGGRLAGRQPVPMAIAAAVLLSLIGVWIAAWSLTASSNQDSLLPDRPFLAVVTQTYGAAWGDGEPLIIGAELYKGQTFELSDGLIELNIGRQARVVVEAPSRVSMRDSQHLAIEYGRLAAEIFETAADGLTVETPVGRAVDLGTRFELRTTDSGYTHLSVLEGEVVWCAPRQALSSGRHVPAGQAISIDSNSIVGNSTADTHSQALALLDESHASVLLAANPRIYLPFSSDQLEQLGLVVGRDSSLISVEGELSFDPSPFIASGDRSITDHTLHFSDTTESYLTIYRALETVHSAGAYTIMLWIRADRIGKQNILGGTTHLGLKTKIGPQLQMLQDGRLLHYVYAQNDSEKFTLFQPSENKITPGRWYHVAITASSHGAMQLYINGYSVGVRRELEGMRIYPYPDLQLGGASGTLGSYYVVAEPFTGEVDELAVFDRELSRDELRDIFRAARLRGNE